MVGATGIEPVTPTMSSYCSSSDLRAGAVVLHIGSLATRQGAPAASGGEHLLHLVDELAQMHRLRQDLGGLRRRRIGIERDRGKAGDEHDLDVGIELAGASPQ